MIRKATSPLSSNPKGEWRGVGADWFPTTSEIGFIEMPQTKVVEAVSQWFNELGRSTKKRSIAGGLRAGLEALVPLTVGERCRWVFLQVAGWTAFFDNGARGTDASPMASYLARRLGCRAIRAVSVPPDSGGYPAVILELYGPVATQFLNYVRTISAANDGGRWRFDLGGEPQEFEEPSLYAVSRISERFPPSALERYMGRLGIPVFDSDSYLTPVLLERTDVAHDECERLTLEQARARFDARRG